MSLESDLLLRTQIKKEEEDTSDIINLDLNKSPTDLVDEWNSKVQLKFKNYSVDSEQSLDLLMKWYITTIKEEAINLEDFQNLKLFTTKHIQLLKLYFVDLNCCFVDNYLDNMEEILLFYVNLEVKSLPEKKKVGNRRQYKKLLSSVCQKIVCLLNLYLLNKCDRICHVVMKVKSNLQSEESKDFLNRLYGNILTKRPSEKSDLEFCRCYILYQKWKTIRKPEDWEKMDEVMYNLHERTPDSIQSNPVLKQILFPKNNSILGMLTHISENHLIIAEEYFKYIKSNKVQEDSIMASEIGDIEIQDDDIILDLAGDTEDEEFERAYKNFVKIMSSVCLENDRTTDQCVNVKVESANEDEDCQIVAVSVLGNDADDADVIHEILDDDEDDIEIIYLKKKEDKQSAPQQDKREALTTSFLESIEVVESRDISTERVSSSTNNACSPLSMIEDIVETSSSSTKVVIADSPSVTQTEQVQGKDQPNSNNTYREKSPIDVVVAERGTMRKRDVVSIETQTEEWLADDDQNKLLQLEKNAQQDSMHSYYYYGLVTPPSDQRPYEHIPPVAEFASYSNVYANIVRTPSTNEVDSLTKATETDSLSPSAEGNNMDNNKILPRSDDLTLTSVAQNKPCSSGSTNQYNPNLIEEVLVPNVEPNMKKKWKKSNKPPKMHRGLLDEAYVRETEPVRRKKHKKSKKTPENYPKRLNEDSIREHSIKEKSKKLNKQPDPGVLPSNQRNTAPGICLNPEENIVSHNQTEHSSSEVQLNDAAKEESTPEYMHLHQQTHVGSLNEGTSIRECTTDPQNISSLCVSTSHRTADAYTNRRAKSRSHSPYEYKDSDTCATSTKGFSATSCLMPDDSQIVSASPDVTSTSTDVQDCVQNISNRDVHTEDNQVLYDKLGADEDIEVYSDNEIGSFREYIEFSEYSVSGKFDNVTQSNIDDVVEEEVVVEIQPLTTQEEDLILTIDETPPVGAIVNICSEPSSLHSHFDNTDAEAAGIEQENEECQQFPSWYKKLKVSVEKIDPSIPSDCCVVTNSDTFTLDKVVNPSADESPEATTQWSNLRETHDLDEAFSGPVSTINETSSCVNPDTNFDLFSSATDCGTALPLNNTSAQSTNDEMSPAFEGMDDFKKYYEENRNNSVQNKTPVEGESPAIVPERDSLRYSNDNRLARLLPRTLESLQATSQSSGSTESCRDTETTRTKNVKRVHIAETIMDSVNSVPRLSALINTENPLLRSILKKPYVECQDNEKCNMRIPPRQMNLKSLRYYKVDTNDPLLQSEPRVCIRPITETEISRWLSINEISRKIRQRKQTVCASPKSIKVDYGKPILRVSFPEEFGQWRPNPAPQTKPTRPEQGTVPNFNDHYCNNVPPQCTNACCCQLISEFASGVVIGSKTSNVNPTSFQYNPFRIQPDPSERTLPEECSLAMSRTPSHCDIAKLIQSLDSPENGNIDTSLSQITGTNENQQPAVVPEVSEFEQNFTEDFKILPIPSDLHNLNLQKFSPSPCFSPQSDSLSHIIIPDHYVLDSLPQKSPSEQTPNISETCLPLKKRKLSVANTKDDTTEEDEDFLGPDLVEEIIKRARAEETDKDDISYPAKPMISIAEIQEKLVEPPPRTFKTPAERKEMPPPPVQTFTSPTESPRIVTEQYNTHTYNNPTINYHMNNVPYPFFPCTSLPYFPPILLPLNSTTTFDLNLVNAQQVPQPSTSSQEPVYQPRRERRRGRKKKS